MQPGRMGWAGDVGGDDPLFPMIEEAMRQRSQSQVSAQQALQNPMPTRFSALANIANVLASRYMEHQANQQLRKGQEALVDARQRDLSKILDGMMPRQVEAAGPPNPDGTRPTETVQPDRRVMLANLMASRDPMFRAMGAKMIEGELFPAPRKTQTVDLGDQIGIMDEAGNIVQRLPKGATPDAALREKGAYDRHLVPSGDTELREFNRRDISEADRGSRETVARDDRSSREAVAEANRRAQEASAEASRNLQRELHGTVSANTAFAQSQENQRFNNMPVETGEGFVPRSQAAGKQGKPTSAGVPDRDYDNARQTYTTMFGSAMYGLRPNAPAFDKWLAEQWPRIRAAGGMTPPGSPTSASQVPMGPAPAAPQRGVADTLPPREQRTAGAIYPTPRGPMKWTGTGWLPAN